MSWHNPLSKKHQARRSNKYGAKRVEISGESYDSKLECEMHGLLKLMERGGLINNIRRQVVVQLTRFVKWRADFVVFDVKRNADIIVEAKGFESERWKVLLQLLPEFSPMVVQIWCKKGSKLAMTKEIIPELK